MPDVPILAEQRHRRRGMLRVLMIEDSVPDAELLELELKNSGQEVSVERVVNAATMEKALTTSDWDVIISDYAVPGFGALPALEVLKRSGRDIPFIIVSGVIGDEMAVAAMRAGAHDYLRKENLFRLLPIIEREMQEAATRCQKRELEAVLRLQITALRSAANAIVITDREGAIQWVNPAFTSLTGYGLDEAIGQNPRMLKSGEHDAEYFRHMWSTILSGDVWRGEVTNRRKDGSLYVEEMTITPVSSVDTISHFVAVKEDITRRKEAEREIAHLASFPQLNPMPVIEIDLQGNILYANPSMRRQSPELLEATAGHPFVAEWASTVALLKARGGQPMSREVTSGRAVFQQNMHYLPELGLVRCYFSDITERKQAEQALRASEERFRLFMDNSPAVAWVKDEHGRYTYVNRTFETYFGVRLEEYRGKTDAELWPADIARNFRENDLAVLGRDSSLEVLEEAINADGAQCYQLNSKFPFRDAVGNRFVAGIGIDITARKHAEEALRQSEERYRVQAEKMTQLAASVEEQNERMEFALQAGGFGEWDLDLRTHQILRSYRHDQIFGYRSLLPEWSYETFLEHVLPEYRAEVDAGFKAAVADRRSWKYETRIRRPDGEICWVASRARITVDTAGLPAHMIGIIMDVTDRKQAEIALEEREQQLRTVLNALPVGVIICDASGRLTQANAAANGIWGGTVPLVRIEEYDRFKGRRPGKDVWLRSNEWALARALQTGEPILGEELEIEAFDGTRKTILNNALPIRDQHGTIIGGVTVNIDITEHKQTEQALTRHEKLASVGRMAATIAHEVNNPLAAALNSIFLVGSDPSFPESARQTLQVAERELGRVAHMTKQTLGFYRESAGVPRSVQIGDLLNQILDLYGPKLKNNSVWVSRKYSPTGRVHAVEGEAYQIISNLVANSIDAMPHGGTLHVRTAGPVMLNGRPMIAITIADTGEGIAVEHLKRIFEPFFTTKQSIGTGLGLWVTRQLVKKNDGQIRLRTRPGKGTAFTVWLPQERRREERSKIA